MIAFSLSVLEEREGLEDAVSSIYYRRRKTRRARFQMKYFVLRRDISFTSKF